MKSLIPNNPMNKYQELELKVAEMQKEIERLKKEEKKNDDVLPDGFTWRWAIRLLKAVDNQKTREYQASLCSSFTWNDTSQGIDYWDLRRKDMNLFSDKDYIQVQKWLILYFQQELNKY